MSRCRPPSRAIDRRHTGGSAGASSATCGLPATSAKKSRSIITAAEEAIAMAFIDTTPPEAAEVAVAAMYLRQQHAWGFVPNYAKVFCHRPEVLARWGQLLTEIRRPMDKRRF